MMAQGYSKIDLSCERVAQKVRNIIFTPPQIPGLIFIDYLWDVLV